MTDKMSQKMTQSTLPSEDSLSDDSSPLDRWGNHAPLSGAFIESPIPEEASFLSSEGFQGNRIQVAIRFRPVAEEQPCDDSRSRRQSHLRPHLLHQSPHEKAWSIQDSGPSRSSVLGTTSMVTQRGVVRKIPGRSVFAMDAAFEPEDETKTVYAEMVKPIVLSAANGQHGTVFVYGQTGSGKTFTMQGGDVDPFIGSRPKGIIQMAAADLFERIESSGTRDWTIKASFFEVYNEEVRDLLVPDDDDSLSSICSRSCLPVLTVREDSAGNVRVKAHEEEINSVQDISRVLRKGNAHRACASTRQNSRSSRSHAIFRLCIQSRPKHQADDGSNMVRTAVLNLVDLAGSENGLSNTGARKREGGKINQSLLALTRVIQSLGLPDKKRPKYIGYRDSKLTRILKPSLQGEACMAILCCASPARADLEQTRSTLKFAASAKLIKINPTVNEVSETAVSKLKAELSELKEALASLQEKYRQRGHEQSQSAPDDGVPPATIVSPSSHCVPASPLAAGHFVMPVNAMPSDASSDASLERKSSGSDDGPPPPIREVAVVLDSTTTQRDARADRDEKAQFLQEKLNASYDLVAGLVKDLQDARGMVHQVHVQNLELQERLRSLELEMEEQKNFDKSDIPSWALAIATFLYAFELNQFLLAALLFLWLSKNFACEDVVGPVDEEKKSVE